MNALAKPSSLKIHFIIGSTRSGTTLLYHIFNNHKNCVSSAEIKHLLLFHNKYHDMKEVTAELIKDVDYYASIIGQASDHSYGDGKLDISLGEKINYFEFCRRIYFVQANHKNDFNQVNTIIDKNPIYTLKAEMLSKILPDAKFLCTVRDYRGFVLSNLQSYEPFAKNVSIPNYSIIWMFYNKLILNFNRKHADKAKIILYEKLILNKEEVFKEICRFLNIAYDINAFNYQENISKKSKEENITSDRYLYKRGSLLKPINAERLNAWENSFTEFQFKIMDFWCGKTGKRLGYKTTTTISLVESIAILVISLPYYIRAWIYFKLKSVKLNFYLNEGRKASYNKKVLKYRDLKHK